MHNNNNNITLYNTDSGDTNVLATLQRGGNSPFIVKSVSISKGFIVGPGPHHEPRDKLMMTRLLEVAAKEAMENGGLINLTQNDSIYSYSFYGPGPGHNQSFIVTAIPTYADVDSSGNNCGVSVNDICDKYQAMSSLRLNITIPQNLFNNISTCDSDTAYAVTVIMDRPLSLNDMQHIQPDDESNMNRRTSSRTAVGFIIIDGFGDISFTWKNC